MVAVEQPRADCGHAAALTQQCGRCLRWCCPECYFPWTALACDECRAEARAKATNPYVIPSIEVGVEAMVEPPTDAPCRERSRSRGGGSHRHRERVDVRTLAARVADLERRLSEFKRGT
jgi:hypothetical protein